MMPLLFLAAVSAELDALDQAVARCDRATASPVFSAEAGRRSAFLLETYREQETIVAARLEISLRRAGLREAGAIKASDEKQLKLDEAAIEDRQRALNDQRMLEGIRRDTMDSMRRYFLFNCPAGKGDR